MNRRATPILFAVLVLMGLLVYYSERTPAPQSATSAQGTGGATVLSLRETDISLIRMKRDYWNSFTLSRGADGGWKLIDPSNESASESAVRKLLAALVSLPVVSVIDMPADDSERHREYGLWKPAMEVTVSTSDGDQTLLVGVSTADGKGVYCARVGRDKIYVTSADTVQALAQDLAAYRLDKP